ncbi:TPA: phage tail protein [Klebsiella pneumoniae]|jgi:hypothetical protein|nr:phage tail protein [Klebsiella pneumoniae]HBR3765179.1 phage tail protein [Klebsiella pneumoniae]HBT0122485.1 phage tail protein [Klebsiella pneumoniae]HBT0150108.1 phage tail protein [Klebsiella pneumoniae]HBT0528217.1 phage tail protein [Klebsiella pneumoniae]
MLKPNQLREAMTASSPLLQRNPESLNMFVDSGRIVSTLASSLSFEYQYQLNILVTDYAGDIDLIIVPVLAWLREHQPDIMATEEKRRTGFTFKADVLSDTTCDLSIDLQLTERVIVRSVDGALHVDHVGEPPLPDNTPYQIYANGVPVSGVGV